MSQELRREVTLSKKPQRTIKEVVDLKKLKTITSDDLLSSDQDRYNYIRRTATDSHRARKDRYVCTKCGYGVYAPIDLNKRPHWKHFRGAPQNCPWWTGIPDSVDHVSAKQFDGKQESPLHNTIKNSIAEFLESDPSAQDVKVEQYIVNEHGRRKPDVQAVYNGDPIAFEVQLATTQIPIILAREEFYSATGTRLVWLTWRFEERHLKDVQQGFTDIYYSHNKNLFSLDDEVIAEIRRVGLFMLKAHAWRYGKWKNQIVRLGELNWSDAGRAFYFPPDQTWDQKFKERWLAASKPGNWSWEERRDLLSELSEKLDLEADVFVLEEHSVPDLLDCLYSFDEGHPVASKQKNLKELSNTFLSSKSCHQYARILRFVAKRTGHECVLATLSVRRKLDHALSSPQVAKTSISARTVRRLFPHWTK